MDINEWGCFSHNIQVVMWFQLKEARQQDPTMPTGGGSSSCICRQATSNMRRDRACKVRLGLLEALGDPSGSSGERLNWTEFFLCSLNISNIALNQSLRESPQG